MTKARGISLKEWMAGLSAPTAQPGNLQRRLSVIYALSRAIADLHQAGVAHRDLKPENIFLDFRGTGRPCGICLIDFGSSKRHGPGFEMPSGYAVLSPYHYAPEQKRNFNRSGRAADDYVLGILSHEILAGTKPFGAKQNHAEVDRKELAESLSRNGHVSYAVASFIAMNLLNMNPVQRGMARQMLQVLESTYPNCCVGG
jgi:serine/threonine protein kinase